MTNLNPSSRIKRNSVWIKSIKNLKSHSATWIRLSPLLGPCEKDYFPKRQNVPYSTMAPVWISPYQALLNSSDRKNSLKQFTVSDEPISLINAIYNCKNVKLNNFKLLSSKFKHLHWRVKFTLFKLLRNMKTIFSWGLKLSAWHLPSYC